MGPARRWPYYVVCAVGIALALVAYRAQWRYSELPDDFAAADLAYPVRVGDHVAATPERLRFLAESWPPGTTRGGVEARGARHEPTLVLRQGRTALVLAGVSGLAFLATALCFFAPRADRPGVRCFFWISLLYGLAIMVGGVYFPREYRLWLTVFGLTQIACLAALPAIFLRLALVFPRRAPLLDRHPWPAPVLGLAATGVFFWQAVVLLRYFAKPTPANGDRLALPLAVADVYMVALTLAGIAILSVRARGLELKRERNQVRWLLWGFAIGAAPYVLLRTVPTLLGLAPLMPDSVDRVVELAIPFAFAMTVVRHQFLDIDVIIRRSLLYGLLAAVLVGCYLVAGIVFGRWLGVALEVGAWILPIALGLGAGIAFPLLRRRLGRWIDRTVFRLAHDRDVRLDRLDAELTRTASPRALADAVRATVAQVLLPERLAVVIAGRGAPVVSAERPPDGLDADLLRPAGASLTAAPHATSMPEVEDPGFSPRLQQAGYVLDQPLVIQDAPAGRILIGRRINERHYVEPDLEFLADCARRAAQHLERIALLQAVAAEALAREHLAEVDRLKSEFLAHVAHDLRTPVTGIAWSARNLVDGVVGELGAEQLEYVHSITQSCEHLNRLVSNLLEVSHLDRAEPRIDLADVAPVTVWRQATRTTTPLAQAKKVPLEVVERASGVLVRASADKLAAVAVNLLDNAIKYAAPGTTVTVTIHAPDAAGHAVSVRDRGPGLGGQSPEALFARFAQGTPSPTSSRKGFGLGLHIAATYLELMGGTLTARDHPDGGAEFTCRLPLSASVSPPGEEGATP